MKHTLGNNNYVPGGLSLKQVEKIGIISNVAPGLREIFKTSLRE